MNVNLVVVDGDADARLQSSGLPWFDDSSCFHVHPGQPYCTESDEGSHEYMNLLVDFDND